MFSKKLFLLAFFLCIALLPFPTQRACADGIETAGNVATCLLPAAALGLTALNNDGRGFCELAESGCATLGVTYALKYSVSEIRPNGADNHSFPSAHSSVSFCSAEFIRKRYGWEYGLPAYAVAAFAAYSRVESGNHWTQDVLTGAGIGIVCSYLLTNKLETVRVAPDVGNNYYGVSISGTFK